MYYLLVAVAAAVALPSGGEKLEPVAQAGLPHAQLTDYDARRIDYKARQWREDLNEETRLHVGLYDSLEACKSARADLRLELRDSDIADRMRSNCFESRTDAETRTADSPDGETSQGDSE